MADIVIGTAGHIDHGKTTLIKHLTGIETDTTKEEKTRGLSINLGFAYLDLPNKERVGIVDVPGHEKFIKNMVAGLPGIDLILLVIDAGEGIMPQTKEHIDILSLLGIQNYMIVLSKCETIDDELKELVKDDIREQLASTLLKEAPIFETDAVAGIGLEELKLAIQKFAENTPEKTVKNIGRLNVDRAFSVKGFGTVVTGTLLEGQFKVGDELTIFPSGKKTKIRSIQIHETDKQEAYAGQRTALNLTNISKEEISRGDVLTNGSALEATWMIDAKVTCLEDISTGFNLWDRVRVLVGTQEVFARLVPIGSENIQPGESGFIQLRLEEQLAVNTGDYFIMRAYSPMVTIGGGQVLDAIPQKHRRFKQDVIDSLKVKEEGNMDHLILDFMLNRQEMVSQTKEICQYMNLSEEKILPILGILAEDGEVVRLSDREWISQGKIKEARELIYLELEKYQKMYRLRPGMPVEELRSKVKRWITTKQLDLLIAYLVAQKQLIQESHRVSHPDFKIELNKYQENVKIAIEKKLKETAFTPIKKEELEALDEKNGKDVLEMLEDKSVTALTFEYVISQEYYLKAVELVTDFINKNGPMTLADFRDMTDSSRKSSMLILEYLDEQQVTKRVENTRELMES
ncbi:MULTISPECIES: selenocysteine-specific translation elongation factor [Vagococcus]|uniref:Selenocysteine-specific elongation factor n=1 Tax=Vagococcus fluvialis bH819 TaxID=1255619 RepID=A0A1X6WKE2_9ENTE|nr:MULTISPECIES: selenocysteine-specific translation elongation factor [Vagococcus]SLM84710.1 Selenocysteine-specific translation elongation factor [Vagococcus fluvialis bH819]HCM89827.1 selenocysteine-specific translation elongation factor [Vagococcus sp.]